MTFEIRGRWIRKDSVHFHGRLKCLQIQRRCKTNVIDRLSRRDPTTGHRGKGIPPPLPPPHIPVPDELVTRFQGRGMGIRRRLKPGFFERTDTNRALCVCV